MYTSIRRYHSKDPEEVTRRVREGFVPRIRQLRGFRGYYALQAEDGTWVSISVFDTREGVEESNRLAAEWVREVHLEELLGGQPPEIIAGESVIEEMAYHEGEQREAA